MIITNAIVAVDNNWGIGCEGKLLYSIPEDMKFFRDNTRDKVLVMGHSTLKSFPNARPLKDRVNIVLSTDVSLKIDGTIICNSMQQLLTSLGQYNTNDIMVIGGQKIYTLMLDYCSTIFLTRIDSVRAADAFFPNLELLDNWQIETESEVKAHNEIKFKFCKYVNKAVSNTDIK